MKRLLLCLVLVGCDAPEPAPQRLAPESFGLSVRFHADRSILQAVARENGQNAEVEGFTILTLGARPRCEIHVVQPRDTGSGTQELLGHELLHCLYGGYHP